MSKVAEYLQGHILGEISSNTAVREALSHDGSVLKIKPEMVAYPRTTNDIRKITRFAWQLAEKGHVLPITARGSGTDLTGAALGKGLVMVFPAHMNAIYEFEAKQKLVRLQPGANMLAVNQSLGLHGVSIPAAPASSAYSTVGGAVANNASSRFSGQMGTMRDYVEQLEVVLANGDVMQTGRISKRELGRKKGQQGMEGDIYRGIDGILEDYADLIAEKLSDGQAGNAGYAIADVRQKDGSFDLTPLFVGSQGTLGIISEMILKADFAPTDYEMAILSFRSKDDARDALDVLRRLEPGSLEYFDAELFEAASVDGRTYDFYIEASQDGPVAAVIAVEFLDFSDRARAKKVKRLAKQMKGVDVSVKFLTDQKTSEPHCIYDVTHYFANPKAGHARAVPLADGVFIPHHRFEEFCGEVAKLADKHHVSLPIYGHAFEGIYSLRAQLDLKKVGDKQKIFKLLDEISTLVHNTDGVFIAASGEGRVKSRFAARLFDDDINELFAAIKKVCDPYGILNPGVKNETDLKKIAQYLNADYSPDFATTYPLVY